jgi:cyclohexadienyl dehydratase
VLCPAAVAEPFDHFDKAYWMTHDAALKVAVDTLLKTKLDAGDYQQAMAAAASQP